MLPSSSGQDATLVRLRRQFNSVRELNWRPMLNKSVIFMCKLAASLTALFASFMEFYRPTILLSIMFFAIAIYVWCSPEKRWPFDNTHVA